MDNKSNVRDEISKLRAELNIDDEFDLIKSDISLFIDDVGSKFVKVVHVKGSFKSYSSTEAYDVSLLEEAMEKWKIKYNEDMPEAAKVAEEPENVGAWRIPYDFKVKLSEEELSFISTSSSIGDVSIDMAWLLIEGLGWRPGKPVDEHDPGWLVVWGEEQWCPGYLDVTRGFLNMPQKPVGFYPPAVMDKFSIFS